MYYLYQDVNDFYLDMLYISLQSIVQEACYRAIPVGKDSRGPRPDRRRGKCNMWSWINCDNWLDVHFYSINALTIYAQLEETLISIIEHNNIMITGRIYL